MVESLLHVGLTSNSLCFSYGLTYRTGLWQLPAGWYMFFSKFFAKVAAMRGSTPGSVGLGSAACVVFCRCCRIAGLSSSGGCLAAPADPPCSPPPFSNIMLKSAPPAGGGRSVSRASRPLGAAAAAGGGAPPEMYRFGQVSLSFCIPFNLFIYISNNRLRALFYVLDIPWIN